MALLSTQNKKRLYTFNISKKISWRTCPHNFTTKCTTTRSIPEYWGIKRVFGKFLDPYYEDDDLMKKFVSLCRDGASSSIGCKNSLYTQLKKDYRYTVFV